MLVSAIGLPAYRERILYGCLARYGSLVRGVNALVHGLPACRERIRCDAMPKKKKRKKKGKVDGILDACVAWCVL